MGRREHTESAVRGRISAGVVLIEVQDSGEWLPAVFEDDARGRGLMLITGLMHALEIDTGDPGTTLRMAFRLSATAEPPETLAEPVAQTAAGTSTSRTEPRRAPARTARGGSRGHDPRSAGGCAARGPRTRPGRDPRSGSARSGRW